MPKSDGKGGRKGKRPYYQKKKVIKVPKGINYTLEQKFFACELKISGKKQKEIIGLFKENCGLEPKP